jgi:hypothetical protein
MYFDPNDLHGVEVTPKNPGIAVAWFGLGQDSRMGALAPQVSLENPIRRDLDDNLTRAFLDVAVLELEWTGDARLLNIRDRIRNQSIVNYVLAADIVIEQSPPTAVTLASLLKGSGAVAIGTYIGLGLAQGSFPLMLVTVPFGIVVVGSAVGVSQGLQNGLNKAIERAISPRKRR